MPNNFLINLCILLIPAYLIRFSIFTIPTNLFEIAVILTFLANLPQLKLRLPYKVKTIGMWTTLFLTSVIISTSISNVPQVSLGILKSWVLIPILLSWMLYASSPPLIRVGAGGGFFERSLIASGAITSLISLLHFVPGERLSGIYDVPNSLALFIVPILVIAITSRSVIPEPSPWRGIRDLGIVAMSLALLFTQSITGIVSVAIVTAIWAVSRKRISKKTILAGTVAALVVVVALLPRMGYFLNNRNHTSLDVRQQLWSVSLDLIQENPIFGIGLGQFEPTYQKNLHERFGAGEPAIPEFVFRDPHNFILSFWLNTGLLGLVSFIAITFLAIRRQPFSPVSLALITMLIFGLTDTIYWKNDLSALYWLLIAITLDRSEIKQYNRNIN